MEASACSHQLRLLRNLGLVTGERHGRSIVHALHRVEHLRLGVRDTTDHEVSPASAVE
ncbi:hypothetical protein DMH12_06395 [Streptomyces sp. WAC 04229]|nr:hypothetical protein DMH12_06395 [Streptomyces sp. WAC 04229]